MLVQQPQIAEALRRQLQLFGGGSMQLDCDSTITPVVIVGSVAPAEDPAFDAAAGFVSVAATAANFSRSQLQWRRKRETINRIEVTGLMLRATLATEVYVGWGDPQPIGVGQTGYKVQQPAGVTVPTACDVLGDVQAGAPTLSQYQQVIYCPANTPIYTRFDDPWVLTDLGTGAAPGLNAIAGTANIGFNFAWEWREWRAAR